MNTNEHLQSIFIEELVETAQRVIKMQRFGPDEIQPGQPHSNRRRLVIEYAHIIAAFEMLEAIGVVYEPTRKMIEDKKDAVEKYMKLSRELGTLI